ncbi:MAG TPA: cysteine peptidase family C39 domain-containing protein [Candidatus Bathyarchaeia archaeon]|nr:cysteine peptidase family C39 domain-containing protein [Candidatus Bathyarchaeia archaeon]
MKPLPVPFDVVVMVVSTVLGALYGRRLYKRGLRLSLKTDARQARLLTIVCPSAICVCFAFMFAENYPRIFWYLPPSVDYHGIRVAWAVILLTVGLMFGAVGYLAGKQSRRAVWAVLVGCAVVFGVGEWAIQNSIFFTMPEMQSSRIDENGVVRQTSGSTCAAAACANVARAYGVKKTEREMVDLLGSTDNGTSTGQIIYGMRRLGFECRKRRIIDGDFTTLNAPALLFVTFGNLPLGHAVSYMGCKDGKAEIWNPQSGKQFLTREQLSQIWLGHAVEVRKAGQE